MTAARSRQRRADLLASFWLRPALMTAAAVAAAELLVLAEGAVDLPSWAAARVYAGGTAGARDVLGAIASSGSAWRARPSRSRSPPSPSPPTRWGRACCGTSRATRGNFTRDTGNQYALGALVATFAFALTALRSVREADEGAFVPQLAARRGGGGIA